MDLPDLVLSRIFFYLNLDITDKFRLRLVCKSWKEFIDLQIGAKRSLCVYDESYHFEELKRYPHFDELNRYPHKDRWPSNGQVIHHSDVLTQTLFENRLGHFWRIQRLALHRTRKETFGDHEVLPKLLELLSSGLVELSLFATGLIMEDGPVKLERLSFPFLKTLRVYEQFTGPLQIVAAELEKLILEHWPKYRDTRFKRNPPIVLSHPEKLKHLEWEVVDRFTPKYLPNLEHLTVRRPSQPFDLSGYRKLKRLDLWISKCCLKPKPVFKNFLQQKQNLRMDELTITHFGFKKCFTNKFGYSRWHGLGIPSDFVRVLFSSQSFLEIIENLPGFTDAYLDQIFGIHLDHSDLDNLSYLDTLVDFFCRTNLVEMRLEGLSSEQSDQLIRFLEGVQGLETLMLKNCKFSKEFYEKLKSVPFIVKLVVKESSNVETCDFIEHINGLVEFEVHQNMLPFDSFDVFKRSKLRSATFTTLNFSVGLRRKCASFIFYPSSQKERKFESSDDLYSFLQNGHQEELVENRPVN